MYVFIMSPKQHSDGKIISNTSAEPYRVQIVGWDWPLGHYFWACFSGFTVWR